jgi:hypothetical protein
VPAASSGRRRRCGVTQALEIAGDVEAPLFALMARILREADEAKAGERNVRLVTNEDDAE